MGRDVFSPRHSPEGRQVLMVRDAMPGDPHTKPEPWTWVREEGVDGFSTLPRA